jgi:mannose-6-phosphate isomerase-like protein (cupin superfamily)
MMTCTVLLWAALPVLAADPPAEAVFWTAADLKGYAKELAPKVDAHKLAFQRLQSFGNHSAMIGHREGDGEAEVHDGQADFFVVQAGAATLVVGGELVEARTTAPGEMRAPSIKGGTRRTLGPGDLVQIPAKLPHQLLVAPGQKFDYFVLKIDTPPAGGK